MDFIDTILDFFGNDSKNLSLAFNFVFQEITKCFGLDKNKLDYAISYFAVIKKEKNMIKFLDRNNRIDVSSSNSKVYGKQVNSIHVKGFTTDYLPMLYFYAENELFLKIKVEKQNNTNILKIESADNADYLTSEKNLIGDGREFFKVNNVFMVQDDTMLQNKIVKIKTKLDVNDHEKKKEFDVKYLRVYDFLNENMLLNFDIKSSSNKSLKILKKYFFDNLNSFLDYEEEFNINQLINVVNIVLNEKLLDFNANDKFYNIYQKLKSCKEGKTQFSIDGLKLTKEVKINLAEKYAHIEFFNENKELLLSYIVCYSNGLTIYRNIHDKNYRLKHLNNSLLISFSQNEMSLFNMNEKFNFFGLDCSDQININVDGDGYLELVAEKKEITFLKGLKAEHNNFLDNQSLYEKEYCN